MVARIHVERFRDSAIIAGASRRDPIWYIDRPVVGQELQGCGMLGIVLLPKNFKSFCAAGEAVRPEFNEPSRQMSC